MALELHGLRWSRSLSQLERKKLYSLLPPERRLRLEKTADPDKEQAVLCAYALLLAALRKQYGWAELPAMEYGRLGKPAFAGHPEICFSLSHADGAALVGVSDRPLGVDIERHRPVSRRMMEQTAGTTDPEAFFACWVRREARTKRTGQGIGTMVRREPPLGPEERYMPLDLFPGYSAGVCSETEQTGEVHLWTLGQLLEYLP